MAGRVLCMHQPKTNSPCLQWGFNSGGETDLSGGEQTAIEKTPGFEAGRESHANKPREERDEDKLGKAVCERKYPLLRKGSPLFILPYRASCLCQLKFHGSPLSLPTFIHSLAPFSSSNLTNHSPGYIQLSTYLPLCSLRWLEKDIQLVSHFKVMIVNLREIISISPSVHSYSRDNHFIPSSFPQISQHLISHLYSVNDFLLD